MSDSLFLSHRVTDASVDGGVLLEDRLHGLVGEQARTMSSGESSGSYQGPSPRGRPAQGRRATDLMSCTATLRSKHSALRRMKSP